MGEDAHNRVVIIGNGMAGLATIEEIRKLSTDAPITVFGEEPHASYNRILLSDVLAGRQSIDRILLQPLEWYERNGVDLRLGHRVVAIDPVRKVVQDAAGRETSYDRLLITVGAQPSIPPIEGWPKPGAYVFRNIADVEAIIARARRSRQAVVIGGGLLGLEAARGLINYGVSVTVLHLMDRLMELQLDPIGAGMLKREIERLGIDVRLATTAAKILGVESKASNTVEPKASNIDDEVTGVVTSSGAHLPAQLVVLCAGIRPDLSLARAAGIATRRGIVVDDRMETSVPGVFAVGDVIEHRGQTYGLVAPLRDQARAAASAITGKGSLRYEGTACMTTLKVAGVNLTSAGEYLATGTAEETVYADTQKGIYKKLVLRGNRLTGMILLGDILDGARLFDLIRTGADATAAREALTGKSAGVAGADIESRPDTDLVCNCNSVTKGAILTAIRERGLSTREEVAACTKASTGCGSCAQPVEDLLQFARGEKKKDAGPRSALPAAPPLPPPRKAPPALGYPAAYPKNLEVERIKQEGLGLDFDQIRERGALALTEDDYYRLKTYGVCSQKHPGYFMLRVRVPGGRLIARQLGRMADLADTHGRGSGHLTTRQDLELHWVRLEEVPRIWEQLAEVGLSTRSACGHTLRNVTACPHSGICPGSVLDAQPWAEAITDYFVQRSELINPAMPNRLNVFFSGCARCAPDAEINDIGFAAQRSASGEPGFALWVGGSLGAHPIPGFALRDWIPLRDVLPACQAVFQIHTRYGNRNKARSRLKFLIEQWGREKFTEVFDRVFETQRTLPENRLSLPPARATAGAPGLLRRLRAAALGPLAGPLPDGCAAQRQAGYVRMAIDVPLGEIRAEQLRALGRVCRRHGNGEVRLTQDQDVELQWVEVRRVRAIVRALRRAGLALKKEATSFRVAACPGTEFCVLAVTNAQGAAREVLQRYTPRDPAKAELLRGVSIRVSGCPNSCAKHQVADIGLAGTMTAVGEERRFSYLLYLGGRLEGGLRLGEVARKGITESMVIPTLDALLDIVWEHRQPRERFQDAVDRLGIARMGELLEARLQPFLPEPHEKLTLVPDLVL